MPRPVDASHQPAFSKWLGRTEERGGGRSIRANGPGGPDPHIVVFGVAELTAPEIGAPILQMAVRPAESTAGQGVGTP